MLSQEHVPPQKAYNEQTMTRMNFEQFTAALYGQKPKSQIQQGGASDYTLCEECNNKTGSWYGGPFVQWARQGMHTLCKDCLRTTPIPFHPTIRPLCVLKQIVCMFLSINSVAFRGEHAELPAFVLQKSKRNLPPNYRFFVYFLARSSFRRAGMTGIIQLDPQTLRPRRTNWQTEFSHQPFGYVMTVDSQPPDDRLCEISHFGSCKFDEERDFHLKLTVLETHFPFPGDYRCADEIREDFRRGLEAEKKQAHP